MNRVLFLALGVVSSWSFLGAQAPATDSSAPTQGKTAPDQAASAKQPSASQEQPSQQPSSQAPPVGKLFLVDTGTHIPLSLINSVSTKNAVAGDRVYLETVFPVLVDGRIVIPPGSYVAGTITEIKRPGRVKGRGEFHRTR